jgi:predicted Zn finger-like uncharacterized protein
MYTHCPHCDTCFRVTTEQLKAARGHVRCGRCFGTFNALEHLVDEPPQPEPPPPALTPAAALKPAPDLPPSPAPKAAIPEPAPVEEVEVEPAVAPPPATAPAIPHPAREAQVERSQLLVEEIQSTPAKPARNFFWLWLGLAVTLTPLLIGQYAWFNLATLAQQPELRPALKALCNIAGCEVPLIKDPYMITLVERDIRNDAERPELLLVKARIINKAPYTQAYPLMELSLHDITGHVIAARRFSPEEYLPGNIDQKQGMASQQVVDILLELADPGKEAVGFEFEFF